VDYFECCSRGISNGRSLCALDARSPWTRPTQLYDTQTIDPVDGQPKAYANNQIPITNPVALYLFGNPKAYPLPNHPADSGDPLGINGNFVGPGASFSENDQGDAKVDWQLRPGDKSLSAIRKATQRTVRPKTRSR
jgi:hypothetical protein